jgi:Tfp pilus assembly protein PilN
MGAPPDFSTRPRARRPARLEQALVLAAAGALVLAILGAVRGAAARDEAVQEVARLRREVDARRARLAALERAATRGSTLRSRTELTARAAPPRVITDLAPLVPDDARLDGLELHYGDRLELGLRVEARTPAAYDRLLEALASSGRLSGVVPGPESREGVVASSLRAVYRPREAP